MITPDRVPNPRTWLPEPPLSRFVLEPLDALLVDDDLVLLLLCRLLRFRLNGLRALHGHPGLGLDLRLHTRHLILRGAEDPVIGSDLNLVIPRLDGLIRIGVEGLRHSILEFVELVLAEGPCEGVLLRSKQIIEIDALPALQGGALGMASIS